MTDRFADGAPSNNTGGAGQTDGSQASPNDGTDGGLHLRGDALAYKLDGGIGGAGQDGGGVRELKAGAMTAAPSGGADRFRS
ncbi:hypothetical protein [Glycomyces arizonensis]|uniref:hypothetical protein n=1 Tax=Glycomyces arizonensis TaxID=256035 RepID=UPI0004136313|nr:hypothetical protein [Glycomyces arizonensis]